MITGPLAFTAMALSLPAVYYIFDAPNESDYSFLASEHPPTATLIAGAMWVAFWLGWILSGWGAL